MSAVLGVPILLALVLAFAIVNSVEIAVVGVNRIRVRRLAEEGSRSARALESLHEEQEKFFAAIVLLQNIVAAASATIGALVMIELIGDSGAIVATLVVAFVLAQLGELTPKVLAAHASERFALAAALPAQALTSILGPVVAVLGWFPGLLSRWLFGVRLEAGPTVTEAELRMLIDISAESGAMDVDEAELLDRVFHFGDRHVHEVMVPRTEAVGIDRRSKVADFYAIYLTAPHSRFPVFDESLDKVTGILGIKDVLAATARGEFDAGSPIEPLVRPALFVPETKLIGDLFREMQATGDQMAIAVDEFGGTAGIVTLEQLLEEMVGQVRDELAPGEREITHIDEQTIQVDGSLSVEEAREELGLDIPEGPYDTIAGYVLNELGHIPEVGESVAIDHHRITVAEMNNLKIELLRVTKS